MTDPLLGTLFGKNGPKVEAALDILDQLSAPVEKGPYSTRDFKVTGGKGLTLLNQPLQITAFAELSAGIGAAGAGATSVFQDGDSWTPGADQCLATLDLQGTLGVAGQGSAAPLKPVSLSFRFNSSAELHYRHYLAVRNGTSRLNALLALVTQSELTRIFSLTGLDDGEVHQLSALFSLSLGAEATLGKDLAFKDDLFPGLAPEVSIDFQFAVNASLNASLYESLRWTVGKGGAFTTNPGWVRLRVEREHKRQLTLGAQFALDVQYNFGSVLEALLNRALALNPVQRAITALADIEKETALLAAGNWDAVKGQIDKAAADRIAEFLDPVLADSKAIQDIVKASSKVVDAYNNLGETLQSFWNGLLNRGDLKDQAQKLRALLTKVQSLPADPKALLTPAEQDLIPVIEALTGLSFEEIWLSSGAAGLVAQVKQEATKALGFLDAIENLPQTVLGRIQGFAKDTGIAGTLLWLQQNATSVAKIQAAATARIEQLLAKLLNKAFDQIDPADLAKIQSWAQTLDGILKKPQEIETRLRTLFKQLDGSVGFKLGLEVDRVSRESSLVDLEFDPNDKATVKALSGLGSMGNLGSLLAALPAPEGNQLASPPAPLPYLLRECTFTSSRLRTSSRSFFFSLLGTTSNTRQRLTESAVTVRQDGNAFSRSATYSGTFTRTTETTVEKNGHSATLTFGAAAGWTADAAGAGKDLGAPYASVDHSLSLTLTRDDDATSADELTAIGGLLTDLGFAVNPAPAAAAAGHATRLAVSLAFGPAALQAFLGDGTFGGAWNLDMLNAAHRWFAEPLTPATANEFDIEGLTRNAILAGLTTEESFQQGWTMTTTAFETTFAGKPFTDHLPSGNVDVVLVRPAGPIVSWGNFNMVRDLIRRRIDGPAALAAAGKAFAAAQAAPSHANLRRLGEKFAFAGDAASPGFWDNPAFAVWLALARVAKSAPASLAGAAGLATLRFKDDVTGAWSDPQTWALEPAKLPQRTPGAGVFPVG